MLDTLKKFWRGVPTFGRLFIAVIFFAIVGGAAGDLVLFFLKDQIAQVVGLVAGVLAYAYLATRAGRVL